MNKSKVTIYTDGACKGNPGKGGWGVVLFYKEHKKELWGGCNNVTNNIMEMTAVVRGLEALKKPCEVVIYSDSKYVIDGATKWIKNWKRNGWRTADKKEVKNKDLWMQIDLLCEFHSVEFRWVRGHMGDVGNELADSLANRGCYGI